MDPSYNNSLGSQGTSATSQGSMGSVAPQMSSQMPMAPVSSGDIILAPEGGKSKKKLFIGVVVGLVVILIVAILAIIMNMSTPKSKYSREKALTSLGEYASYMAYGTSPETEDYDIGVVLDGLDSVDANPRTVVVFQNATFKQKEEFYNELNTKLEGLKASLAQGPSNVRSLIEGQTGLLKFYYLACAVMFNYDGIPQSVQEEINKSIDDYADDSDMVSLFYTLNSYIQNDFSDSVGQVVLDWMDQSYNTIAGGLRTVFTELKGDKE